MKTFKAGDKVILVTASEFQKHMLGEKFRILRVLTQSSDTVAPIAILANSDITVTVRITRLRLVL